MSSMTANASALESLIHDCDEETAVVVPIPYGLTADDRALELNLYSAAVGELRDAGWELRTRVHRLPAGELFEVQVESHPVAS